MVAIKQTKSVKGAKGKSVKGVKGTKVKRSQVEHKKKAMKIKGVKVVTSSHKMIRSGSSMEKMYNFWLHLSPTKRKVITETADALVQNTAETRRVRSSLVPKVKKAKQPMTGYILFTHENHARVKSENPNLKPTQLMGLLGKTWKELENSLKDSYKSRHVAKGV